MKHLFLTWFATFAFYPSAALAQDIVREMPHWPGRSYHLHFPASTTGALPLVMVLHGGGHNREKMERITCPEGNERSPWCMNALADRKGFAVVYPDGTVDKNACDQNPARCNDRGWNAGGGSGGYACVSNYACTSHVDDIQFFKDLWDDIAKIIPLDRSRIYSTGLSNGGAMSHRLGCELADRVAAVAPVGGGNQFSTGADCVPARPIAVLDIHGGADPAWPYEGGVSSLPTPGNYYSIRQTVADWLVRDGCMQGAAQARWIPDTVEDGTHVWLGQNSSCAGASEVIHLLIAGGGHMWPGGWNYGHAELGLVTHQFRANEVVWNFFRAHSLPSR